MGRGTVVGNAKPPAELPGTAVDTHVDPWTKGDAVFMHHGIGRNAACWIGWVPYFSRAYTVVRHQVSSNGDGRPLTLENLAEQAARGIQEHADGQVHFIGESLGGMVGVWLAANRPELIRSLTLVSTPLVVDDSVREVQSLGHPNWSTAVREMGARAWWRESRAVLRDITPEEVTSTPATAWMSKQFEGGGERLVRELVDVTQSADLRSAAARVRAPVLVLVPSGSKLVNRPEEVAHYDLLRTATTELIPGGHHEMYIEMADVLAPKVRAFVDRWAAPPRLIGPGPVAVEPGSGTDEARRP